MKRRQFIGVLGAATVAVGAGAAKNGKPKYIFLMIGDGMGAAQVRIAESYARMKAPSKDFRLAMNRLPVKGRTTTDDAAGKITDSAAAGTALACGSKTLNGMLGLAQDIITPLRSVAFDAKDAGKKVGIVTSVPVDHATPASFYAQVPKRSMYYEIDEFMLKSGFDYFAGETMLGRGKAKGKLPTDQLVKNAGYRHVRDRAGFDALKKGDAKVLVEYDLGYAIDTKTDLSLADYTRKGIELLDGENGFFMMVEGGKIDWSGHANDLATNIHETLAFDEAIAVVLDFCMRHPDESLLVVTADHETGGLQLEAAPPPRLVSVIDAQHYQGSHFIDEIKKRNKAVKMTVDKSYDYLVDGFGLGGVSGDKKSTLLKAIEVTLSVDPKDGRSAEIQKMYGKKSPAVVACLHEVAERAGSRWTSFTHTATPVQTTAYGRWADRFAGESDNADIGKYLRDLATGS
jgi:alkaline phosphatase